MSYYQDEGPDFAFRSVTTASCGFVNNLHLSTVFFQVNEEANNSDEDKYTHTLRSGTLYKPFEDARELYVLFALELLKAYEETKKAAMQLEYLYDTAFRFGDFAGLDFQSSAIHLGFFYETVLGDPDIMVSLNTGGELK